MKLEDALKLADNPDTQYEIGKNSYAYAKTRAALAVLATTVRQYQSQVSCCDRNTIFHLDKER